MRMFLRSFLLCLFITSSTQNIFALTPADDLKDPTPAVGPVISIAKLGKSRMLVESNPDGNVPKTIQIKMESTDAFFFNIDYSKSTTAFFPHRINIQMPIEATIIDNDYNGFKVRYVYGWYKIGSWQMRSSYSVTEGDEKITALYNENGTKIAVMRADIKTRKVTSLRMLNSAGEKEAWAELMMGGKRINKSYRWLAEIKTPQKGNNNVLGFSGFGMGQAPIAREGGIIPQPLTEKEFNSPFMINKVMSDLFIHHQGLLEKYFEAKFEQPLSVLAKLGDGQSVDEAKDVNQAITYITEFLNIVPLTDVMTAAEFTLRRGTMYINQGEYNKAVLDLEHANSLTQNYEIPGHRKASVVENKFRAGMLYFLGGAYAGIGDYKKAEKYQKQALKLGYEVTIFSGFNDITKIVNDGAYDRLSEKHIIDLLYLDELYLLLTSKDPMIKDVGIKMQTYLAGKFEQDKDKNNTEQLSRVTTMVTKRVIKDKTADMIRQDILPSIFEPGPIGEIPEISYQQRGRFYDDVPVSASVVTVTKFENCDLGSVVLENAPVEMKTDYKNNTKTFELIYTVSADQGMSMPELWQGGNAVSSITHYNFVDFGITYNYIFKDKTWNIYQIYTTTKDGKKISGIYDQNGILQMAIELNTQGDLTSFVTFDGSNNVRVESSSLDDLIDSGGLKILFSTDETNQLAVDISTDLGIKYVNDPGAVGKRKALEEILESVGLPGIIEKLDPGDTEPFSFMADKNARQILKTTYAEYAAHPENIKMLDLSGDGVDVITSLNGVERFVDVQKIYAENNYIRNFMPLKGLKKLRVLDLSGNDDVGDPLVSLYPLVEVKSLEELNLSNNDLTLGNIGWIMQMKGLNKLNVSTTILGVDDAGVVTDEALSKEE
ncbi:MAG: hypothetical protein V1647_00055, partial [Pseudomonadota bacterium]